MTIDDAYAAAGFKPNRGNAARLNAKESIQHRIAELQGSTADQITDVRDLARTHTREAIETLVSVMKDAKAPHSARVAASNVILDRGYGKAVQHIEAEINVYDSLSLDEQRALLAVLDALAAERGDDSSEPAPTHH